MSDLGWWDSEPSTEAGRELYEWASERPIWDGKGEPQPLTEEQEDWNDDLRHAILKIERER